MPVYYTYPMFLAGVLTAQTIKALLLTNSSPGFNAAHDFVDDVTANEVSASGYSRQAVSGTVTSDADGAYFTPTNYVEFGPMIATVRYVVFFNDTGNDATSRVIGMVAFDEALSLNNRKLRLTFSGNLIEGAI